MNAKIKRIVTVSALLALLLTLILIPAQADDSFNDAPQPDWVINSGTCRDRTARWRNNSRHRYELYDWEAPTCEEGGTAYYRCSYCDATMEKQYEALGHDWYEWTEDFVSTGVDGPTCGMTVHWYTTCTRCGEAGPERTEYYDHQWSDWKVSEKATCEKQGMNVRSCARCGEKEWEYTPALGHQWGNWTVSEKATCENQGMNVRSCARCGNKDWEYTPALGHQWSEWTASEKATCESQGVNVRSCSRCGNKDWEYTPALGHLWDEGTTVRQPDCTQTGEIRYVCKRDASHVRTESLPVSPQDHWWDEGAVTKEPTCVQPGVLTYTCRNNSAHTRTEAIPMNPDTHDWAQISQKNATCADEGYVDYKCRNCDQALREVLSATGKHSFGLWIEGEKATCAQYGWEYRVCAVCGLEEYRDIEPLGHQWGEWKIVEQPGTLSKGKEQRACTVCGEVEQRDIPPQYVPQADGNASVWLEVVLADDAGAALAEEGAEIAFYRVLTNTGDVPVYIAPDTAFQGAEYVDQQGGAAAGREPARFFDPALKRENTGYLLLPGEVLRFQESERVTLSDILNGAVERAMIHNYAYVNADGAAVEAWTNEVFFKSPLLRVGDAYTLLGLTAHYDGYRMEGGYPTPVIRGVREMIWKDHIASPAASYLYGVWFYEDSGLDFSTRLDHEPEIGQTYFFTLTPYNTVKGNHAIDFSQIDPAQVRVTMDGFTVKLVSGTPGDTGRNEDGVKLLFAATYYGDGEPYQTADEYALLGLTAHYGGYRLDGAYATPLFYGIQSMAWENDIPAPYVHSMYGVWLYQDPGLAFSTRLDHNAVVGETYYFTLTPYNKIHGDHTIDFSRIDPAQVHVTMDGFAVELVSSTPGDTGRDEDGAELLFAATYLGDADASHRVWLHIEAEKDAGAGKRYIGAHIPFDIVETNTGDQTVYIYTTLKVDFRSGDALLPAPAPMQIPHPEKDCSVDAYPLNPGETLVEHSGITLSSYSARYEEITVNSVLDFLYQDENGDWRIGTTNQDFCTIPLTFGFDEMNAAVDIAVHWESDAGVGKGYEGALVPYDRTLTNVGNVEVFIDTEGPAAYTDQAGNPLPDREAAEYELPEGQGKAMGFLLYPGEQLHVPGHAQVTETDEMDQLLDHRCMNFFYYLDEQGRWQEGLSEIDFLLIPLTLDAERLAPKAEPSLFYAVTWASDAGVGKRQEGARVTVRETFVNTGDRDLYLPYNFQAVINPQLPHPLEEGLSYLGYQHPLIKPGETLTYEYDWLVNDEEAAMGRILVDRPAHAYYEDPAEDDGLGTVLSNLTHIDIPLSYDAFLQLDIWTAPDAGWNMRYDGAAIPVYHQLTNTGSRRVYIYSYQPVAYLRGEAKGQVSFYTPDGEERVGYALDPGDVAITQGYHYVTKAEAEEGRSWFEESILFHYQDGQGVWRMGDSSTVECAVDLTEEETQTSLSLSVKVREGYEKPAYKPGDFVAFDLTLTNNTDRDLDCASYYLNQGCAMHLTVPLKAGESRTASCGRDVYDSGDGWAHFTFDATAMDPGMFPEVFPTLVQAMSRGAFHANTVTIDLPLTVQDDLDADRGLTLTGQIHTASKKGAYQEAQAVTFDLTVTNHTDRVLYHTSYYENGESVAYMLLPLKPGEAHTYDRITGVFDSGDGMAHIAFQCAALDQARDEVYNTMEDALEAGAIVSNMIVFDLPIAGQDSPAADEGLILTGHIRESDRKSAYQQGEVVTFDLTLINNTGKDLYRTTFFRNESDQLYFLKPFPAGDSYTYDMRASVYDSGDGFAHFVMQCAGMEVPIQAVLKTIEEAHGAGAVLSNQLTFDLPVLGADPAAFDTGLILTAQLRASDRKSAYQEGETVTIDVTLINNTGKDLYRTTLFKHENEALYFLKTFGPGETYTYDMTARIYDSGDGYARIDVQSGAMDKPVDFRLRTLADAQGAGAILSNKAVFELPLYGANPTAWDSGLALTGALREADRKSAYREGEIVTFDLTMTNLTEQPLYRASYFKNGKLEAYRYLPMEPGEAHTYDLRSFVYDSGDGYAYITLACAASADPDTAVMETLDDALAANATQSNQLTFKLPIEGKAPVESDSGLILSGRIQEDYESDTYEDGSQVRFNLTLTNHTGRDLYQGTYFQNGKDVMYMFVPLKAGESYTYDRLAQVWDGGDGYAHFVFEGAALDAWGEDLMHTPDDARAMGAIGTNRVSFDLPIAQEKPVEGSLVLSGQLRESCSQSAYEANDKLIFDLNMANQTDEALYRASFYVNGKMAAYLIHPLQAGDAYDYDRITSIAVSEADTGEGYARFDIVCAALPTETSEVYETLEDAIAAGALLSNQLTFELPMRQEEAETAAEGYDVEDLRLEVTQTSEIKEVYRMDDVLTFDVTLTNQGTVRYGYAEIRALRNGYTGGFMDMLQNEVVEPLLPGDSKTISFSYTVTETDAKIGSIYLHFACLGYYSQELGMPQFAPDYEMYTSQYGISNEIVFNPDVEPGARLLLTAEMDPAYQREEYHLGDEVLFHYTLTNNGGKTLLLPAAYQQGHLSQGFDASLAPGESVSADALCAVAYSYDEDMGIVGLEALAWLEEAGPVAAPWPETFDYSIRSKGGAMASQQLFWFALAEDEQEVVSVGEAPELPSPEDEDDFEADLANGLRLEVKQLSPAQAVYREGDAVTFLITLRSLTEEPLARAAILADLEDLGDYVSLRALFDQDNGLTEAETDDGPAWSVEDTILITWKDVQAGSVTCDWVGRAWVADLYDSTANEWTGSAPGLLFSRHRTITLVTGETEGAE